MSQVSLYMYSNCSSCKSAEKILRARNVDLQIRDTFKDRLGEAQLRIVFERIGASPHEMLSRRSIPYRELGLALKNLDNSQLLHLMAEHPALIRRPIIETPNGAQVGFHRASVERLAEEYGRRSGNES